MTIQVLMPALSPTMEEGKLAKWNVKEGDKVGAGDIIAEIETDKATMEYEAADEGTVGKIVVPEGTDGVKVNEVIAILLEEGEDEDAAEKAAAPKGDGGDKDKDEDKAKAEDKAEPEQKKEEKPAAKKGDDDSEVRGDLPLPQQPGASVPDPEPEEADWPEGTEMKTQTVREALRDSIAEEMRRDEHVFIMGEEVAEYEGAYKITQGILAEFGARRVVDTPITEHGFTGLAIGAAMGGLRPILEFMTFNFAMQAMDQIINSAAKTNYMSGGQMRCPIVFRGPNGAAARVAAQHSQDFAAWYSHVPGLKVIQPYSAADYKGLFKAAVRDPNPVIFLENEILYGKSFDVPDLDDFTVKIGKAKTWREGSDVTLVSFGIGMTYALEAADRLAEEGIEAEVIDLRTLRPLDKGAVIRSVKKTNRCVTVEEGFPVCSIGNHISAILMQEAFDYLDAPVINCTGKDVPMPYAANLEKLALVTTDEVVEAAKSVCYR